MALTPGTRLGVYEVIAQIGEGGMGQVYRARDAKLDRDVAIKILPAAFAHDADRLERFQREAKTLASLNHPNIAAIYGLEESRSGGSSDPPITALVMELVAKSLLEVVKSRRVHAKSLPVVVKSRRVHAKSLPVVVKSCRCARKVAPCGRQVVPLCAGSRSLWSSSRGVCTQSRSLWSSSRAVCTQSRSLWSSSRAV